MGRVNNVLTSDARIGFCKLPAARLGNPPVPRLRPPPNIKRLMLIPTRLGCTPLAFRDKRQPQRSRSE